MEYINEYTIILFIIIFILISKYDIKYILLILIVIFIVYKYYNKIIIKEIYNQNSNIKYNKNLSILFDKLDKYKNINLIEYRYGLNYWEKFIYNIKLSNNDNIIDSDNYYNNTELYLNTSIKHFKSLSIPYNNENLIEIINDIYKEGYILLKNLSEKFNKKWYNKPNTLTKQIIFNAPKPHNISFI